MIVWIGNYSEPPVYGYIQLENAQKKRRIDSTVWSIA